MKLYLMKQISLRSGSKGFSGPVKRRYYKCVSHLMGNVKIEDDKIHQPFTKDQLDINTGPLGITWQLYADSTLPQDAECFLYDNGGIIQNVLETLKQPINASRFWVNVKLRDSEITFEDFCITDDDNGKICLKSTLGTIDDKRAWQLLTTNPGDFLVTVWMQCPDVAEVTTPQSNTLFEGTSSCHKIFQVQEILEMILERVFDDRSSRIRQNIKNASSVNHSWREATYNVLKNNGKYAHPMTTDTLKKYIDKMPGGFPIGYVLPLRWRYSGESLHECPPKVLRFFRKFGSSVTWLDYNFSQNDVWFDEAQFPGLKTLVFRGNGLVDEFVYITRLSRCAENITSLRFYFKAEFGETKTDILSASFPLPPNLKSLKIDTTLVGPLCAMKNLTAPFPKLQQVCITINNQGWDTSEQVEEYRLAAEGITWMLANIKASIKSLIINEWSALKTPKFGIYLPHMPKIEEITLISVDIYGVSCPVEESGMDKLKKIDFMHIRPISIDSFFNQCYSEVTELALRMEQFFANSHLVEEQMMRITNCVPNCTKLTLLVSSMPLSSLVLNQVYLGMPKLLNLYIIFNGRFEFPDQFDSMMTAQEIFKGNQDRKSDWDKVGPVGIANLKNLKQLRLRMEDRHWMARDEHCGWKITLSEYLVNNVFKKMDNLKVIKLENAMKTMESVTESWINYEREIFEENPDIRPVLR